MAAPMFTDFNIIWEKDGRLKELIALAMKLGYERVAVNNFITDLRGGKKQKEKVAIVSPSEIKLIEEEVKCLQQNRARFEQFSRITAVLEDASNTHRLSSPEVQAYDILAVQPTDEETFKLACSTLEVDIIQFDLSQPLGFLLKRPLLNLAAKRGIHFEICYSPALKDSNAKRQTIANAIDLIEKGKGKNIILSSAANKPMDLRSPYDVINLSKIFGLDHVQAKNCIAKNTRAVVMHAASRKSCNSVISATLISSLSTSDKWVWDAHKKLMNRSDSKEDSEDDSEASESDVKEMDGDEPVKKRIKV